MLGSLECALLDDRRMGSDKRISHATRNAAITGHVSATQAKANAMHLRYLQVYLGSQQTCLAY